jgi:hypothetical protein
MVPLGRMAHQALAQHLRSHAHEVVFCAANGGLLWESRCRHHLHRACKAAGLRPISWHGLRRALVIAGSETQVMSLWRVEDRIARSLMEAYYRNLLAYGMGRSEALRQVQLAWLKSGDVYASPYYWAVFVVSGNDSPLDVGSASTVPRVQRSPRGCACKASSSDVRQGWGIALLLGLVLVLTRRRWRIGLSVKRP